MIIGRKRRFVTLFIPLILLLTLFVGCASRQKIPDQTTAPSPSETTAVTTTAATTAADTTAQTTAQPTPEQYAVEMRNGLVEGVFAQDEVDTAEKVVALAKELFFEVYADMPSDTPKEVVEYVEEFYFREYVIFGWSDIYYGPLEMKKDYVNDQSEFTVCILYRRNATYPTVGKTSDGGIEVTHPGRAIPDLYGSIVEGGLEGWDICRLYFHFVKDGEVWRFGTLATNPYMADDTEYHYTDDIGTDYYLNGRREAAPVWIISPPSK